MDVDHTSYIAKSRASLEALKLANLLKSLNINVLILRDKPTRKQTFAKYELSNTLVMDRVKISTLDTIMIKNFTKLKSQKQFYKTWIIATSTNYINKENK